MDRLPLLAVGLAGALSLALSGSGVTAVLGSGCAPPSPQLVALSRPNEAAAAERSFADDLVAVLARELAGNVVLSPTNCIDPGSADDCRARRASPATTKGYAGILQWDVGCEADGFPLRVALSSPVGSLRGDHLSLSVVSGGNAKPPQG